MLRKLGNFSRSLRNTFRRSDPSTTLAPSLSASSRLTRSMSDHKKGDEKVENCLSDAEALGIKETNPVSDEKGTEEEVKELISVKKKSLNDFSGEKGGESKEGPKAAAPRVTRHGALELEKSNQTLLIQALFLKYIVVDQFTPGYQFTPILNFLEDL